MDKVSKGEDVWQNKNEHVVRILKTRFSSEIILELMQQGKAKYKQFLNKD